MHISASLQKKIKRSPNNKYELPEPIKTSWGRMVSRGMLPKELPSKYTVEGVPIKKTGGRGIHGKYINWSVDGRNYDECM